MYCTRCGKKIDYDAFVCNECRAQEEALLNGTPAEEPKAEAAEPIAAEEPVATATATAEPVVEPASEPVKDESTYSAPQNQQYYYSNPNNAYTPYTPYQPQPTVQPEIPAGNPRMFGFGKALASTILSFVAYIFSAITMGVATVEFSGATVVLLMMTLGMAIPALVMGVQSIKTFTRAGSLNLPRPIATLVLGIVGTAITALDLFICLISLMMAGAY